MGANKLVLLELLLALCCRLVEPSVFTKQFSQNTVELLPCEKLTTSVSLYKSTLVTIMANLSHCPEIMMDTHIDTIGFRISTQNLEGPPVDGDADSFKLVVFTARQSSNNDGFVSWNAPLNYSSMLFPNVSHTMCTVKKFMADNMPLFYIDVFTSSNDSVTFTIEVEPVQNFILQTNQTYTIEVGQATPQIYYYKIPNDVELVTVEASSKIQEGCTIVSIQDNNCPVNDLLENVKSKGTYQTMINSSFLTLNADSIPNREFLLVFVTGNRSLCYTDTTSIPNRTMISVRISSMTPTREYIWAMMLPVVICFAGIYIASFVVCCCYAPRCEPKCIPIQFINCGCNITSHGSCKRCAPEGSCNPCVPIGSCRCICCYGPDPIDSDDHNNVAGDEKEDTVINCKDGVWKYVCCKNPTKEVELCISSPEPATRSDSSSPKQETPLLEGSSITMYGSDGATKSPTEAGDDTGEGSVAHKAIPPITLQSNKQNPESNPERISNSNNVQNSTSTDREQKAYHVYGWNTVTVGIFYALPALQLVLSEQKILDRSGDQDTCYYNFKCAHPIGPFTAFNNMWSNIGYILLGGLFIIIVLIRHCQYLVRRCKNKQYVESHGVPQFFGVYYAMGFGLILEGFMSSFYHICPSNANFQFDTAFMFITGGIILVKVYQNRHPNIQANAFIAFFAFAIIIFFTVIGIYNDVHHPIAVKVSFLFFALVVIIFFLAHFYPLNFNLRDNQDIFKECTCSCGYRCMKCISGYCYGFGKLLKALSIWLCSCYRWKEFCSAHQYRIAKHIVILICNMALGIGMCIRYDKVGIATAILTFFVVNIVLYLVIYCAIKVLYGEPWTWLSPVLLVLLLAAWKGAYHFYGTVTEWSDTPALSRTLNKPCILEGFYDAHDVWHFLSACGMFFAFLFVLVIDDGVVNMKQETLLKRAV